jgi:hypothetical protein
MLSREPAIGRSRAFSARLVGPMRPSRTGTKGPAKFSEGVSESVATFPTSFRAGIVAVERLGADGEDTASPVAAAKSSPHDACAVDK